jgi:hypothetical protein
MPTFKVEMRLHKTVTLTVEAESEDEVNDVFEELGDDLDPEMYWKAKTFEDWNQGNPVSITSVAGNPKADYVIGKSKTRLGRDFIAKQESEWLKGVKE